jgi:hypothetical protein
MKKHLCVKCGSELKETTLNMGDPFGAFSPVVRFCTNSVCEYGGILTYGERPQKDEKSKEEL